MHLLRGLAALLSLGLLGLAPVALAAPAQDAVADRVVVAERLSDATTAARAKPRRELNDRSVQRGGKWFIKGRVTPDGAKKTVVFQRKLAKNAKWKNYRKVKTDKKGRYAVRVEFPASSRPTWYYKGFVRSTAKYAASPTERIYTACRRAVC